MKLSHVIYAIAALGSVSAIALTAPSRAMEPIAPFQAAVTPCDPDHLERPCDAGVRSADVLDGAQVIVS